MVSLDRRRWLAAAVGLWLCGPAGAKLEDTYRSEERDIEQALKSLVTTVNEFNAKPESGYDRGDAQRYFDKVEDTLEKIQKAIAPQLSSLKGGDKEYAEDVKKRLEECGRTEDTLVRRLPQLSDAYKQYLKDLATEGNDLVAQQKERSAQAEDLLDDLTKPHEADSAQLAKEREAIKKLLQEFDLDHAVVIEFVDLARNGASVKLASVAKTIDNRQRIRLSRSPWRELEAALSAVTDWRRGSASVVGQSRKALDGWNTKLLRSTEAKELTKYEDLLRQQLLAYADEYPGMDQEANKAYLLNGSIKGERLMIANPKEKNCKYRILVTIRQRDVGEMRDWVQDLAEDLGQTEFNKRYPGNGGSNSWERAIERKVPEGWQIHHQTPLYVGAENGGLDDPNNYELIRTADHQREHRRGGGTYTKWGPPSGLYRSKDKPNDELEVIETLED
ncbi:MAG: hypothetical protein IT204_12445 [Fimbriimonadaceae bacterium]|nr:hypothetical protein [Fimbriimonadaceae bacterium]